MIRRFICRLFGHNHKGVTFKQALFEGSYCLRCNHYFKPVLDSNEPLIPDKWAKTIMDMG